MSEFNQALSQLAKRRHSSLHDIQPVMGADIKQKPRWVWAVGGFLLSLAAGGWALSGAPSPNEVTALESAPLATPKLTSPTQHITTADVTMYQPPAATLGVTQSSPSPKAANVLPATPVANAPQASLPIQDTLPTTPQVNAPSSAPEKAQAQATSSAKMSVQQVSLTPRQLAFKAQERAEKALDSNDYDEAIMAYQDALRYTPEDERLRQKLAALYYGKEDLRRAYQLLQEGIQRHPQGAVLRIALAQLFVQENEIRAALTPLKPMIHRPTVDYLSLRAALATKNQENPIALESYQTLVQLEPSNARWWLGLGIQHERAGHVDLAQAAYRQALAHVGISSGSITFVQQRLQVLETMQGSRHAN